MLIPLLTYLLLFVTPLIVIPGINLRFEPPKVILAEFLIEVLVIYSFMTGKFRPKEASVPLVVILGCLFLLSLLHLILTPTQQNLFGNVFRLQGTILFWHFLILTLIAQNLYFRLKEKYIYLFSFTAICAGAAIFGSNSADRLIGSLGEPNALGAVIILIFPFVFLSFRSVWVRAIGVIGAVGIINFSQSKSALIAFGLELLFLWLIKITRGRHLLASISCFILLLLSFSLPVLERQYFLKTNTDPAAYRFEDRAEIWEVALTAGFDSPLFGSGLESIQGKIKETAVKMNVNAQYQTIDSSHNLLLDFWIWGGAVGLGLLALLGLLGIKNMIQKRMLLELTVFIGLLTVLSFNPTTVSVLAGFWWVIGRSFAKLDPE